MTAFTDVQFQCLLTLTITLYFLWLGYTSTKRSGGVFMMLSGFSMMSLTGILHDIYPALYTIPFFVPVGCFVVFLGVFKWWSLGRG